MFHAYLQRGTLQELGSLQKQECNSSNCHMRLQWTHPPRTRVLQLEKWQTKVSSPSQAEKPQATWLPFKTLSRGPIVLHPSLHFHRLMQLQVHLFLFHSLQSVFFSLKQRIEENDYERNVSWWLRIKNYVVQQIVHQWLKNELPTYESTCFSN